MHLLHPTPQEKRLQDKKTSYESPLCGKYRYTRFVYVTNNGPPFSEKRAYEPGLGLWGLGSGKSLRNCSWKERSFSKDGFMVRRTKDGSSQRSAGP